MKERTKLIGMLAVGGIIGATLYLGGLTLFLEPNPAGASEPQDAPIDLEILGYDIENGTISIHMQNNGDTALPASWIGMRGPAPASFMTLWFAEDEDGQTVGTPSVWEAVKGPPAATVWIPFQGGSAELVLEFDPSQCLVSVSYDPKLWHEFPEADPIKEPLPERLRC